MQSREELHAQLLEVRQELEDLYRQLDGLTLGYTLVRCPLSSSTSTSASLIFARHRPWAYRPQVLHLWSWQEQYSPVKKKTRHLSDEVRSDRASYVQANVQGYKLVCSRHSA